MIHDAMSISNTLLILQLEKELHVSKEDRIRNSNELQEILERNPVFRLAFGITSMKLRREQTC